MSERQESGKPRSTHNAQDEGADERKPLDRVKAPREWRSGRNAPEAPARVAGPPAEPRPALPDPPTADANPALMGASESQVQEPPVAQPAAPVDEVPDLPDRYHEDRLVLLVRDPWWAYAWWEVTDATFAAAREQLPEARFVLRLYNVTQVDWDGSNHHTVFDVEVHDAAGSWFLDLAKPGDSFCAEVGLLAADGRFVAMVRSNAITLPTDRVSPVIDEEWMIPDADWQRMFEAAGGGVTMGVGSGEVRRMMEGRLHLDLSSGSLAEPSASRTQERR